MSTATAKREQIFAMWKRTGKKGNAYFTGKLKDQEIRGFYNTEKKNLKEPDIRIYGVDGDGKLSKEEIISLWCNATKNGKKILTGKLNGEKVVGFINANATPENKQPYFSVYFSEEKENKGGKTEKPSEKAPF